LRLPRAKKPAPATTAISEPSANHSTSAPVAASVGVIGVVAGVIGVVAGVIGGAVVEFELPRVLD
jgi:hypothetical protein